MLAGMKPIGSIPADALGPDPIAAPANVTADLILNLPPHVAQRTDMKAVGLMLFTEGAPGSVTVEVYCLDESNPEATAAQRRFRKLGADVVITQTGLFPVIDLGGRTLIPHGKVYLRVTVGNAANVRVHAVLA